MSRDLPNSLLLQSQASTPACLLQGQELFAAPPACTTQCPQRAHNNPTSAHPRQFIAPVQSCRKAKPCPKPLACPCPGRYPTSAVCQLKLPKPTQATQSPLVDPNPLFAMAMRHMKRHIAARICCRSGRQARSRALSGMRGAARGAVQCREPQVPKNAFVPAGGRPQHAVNVFRAQRDRTGRRPAGVKPGDPSRALRAQELRPADKVD